MKTLKSSKGRFNMDMQKVGSRGTMVTYQELADTEFACTSNIYIISCSGEMVVIDTFLGPRIMADTFQELEANAKEVKIVINTHSDWDHIWGNSYFKNSMIVAHKNFAEYLMKTDTEEFQELEKYAEGPIEIIHPTLTFDKRIYFEKLGIEVFYSPGHTGDSISIYDTKDKILIVGDNCESPIPSYVNGLLLEEHLESLKNYLTYDFEFIIPGHGKMMTRQDLVDNIQYIEDLIEGDPDKLKFYEMGESKLIHLTNQLYMENSINQ